MSKTTVVFSAAFDKDLDTLLKYLAKSLGSKDSVEHYLNTKSEEYFGMTPLEFIAVSGEQGPKMILQNIICGLYQKSSMALAS